MAPAAFALELDWSGQFRAEYNFVHNYSLDSSDGAGTYDGTRAGAGGYYVPPGGSTDASFQTLFLKIRPKIIVNDNIYIKSEWWVGDPIFGLFGNGVPYSADQKRFYSNQNRGSTITAQRFWAEFLSDIGTVQVGRAPLHWGLGVVWNNGDNLWDRYESTTDTLRLISKFGAFSFMPSFNLYSAGNSVGGGCNFFPGLGCISNVGDGGVREYTLALKYENLDEDLEGGLNFIRRLGGAGQDPAGGYQSAVSMGSFSYNIWDLYARKHIGKFTFGLEAPITTGSLGTSTATGLDYGTFALAVEADWKINDAWELQLKTGHAPGQTNSTGPVPTEYRAFFFNPAYRLGMIMFNYQLANFSGLNTLNNANAASANLKSPYENPIVNANYLMMTGLLHTDKWTFDASFIYAQADKTAQSGQYFQNMVTREMSPGAAVSDQGSGLGVETDLGAMFQWDEYFQFRLGVGVYFPGSFYKFSNVAGIDNQTNMVFGSSARVGITF
ncbi:hypothetical protein WDW37_16970 [Bdellovibrionota bacterium FG-1]